MNSLRPRAWEDGRLDDVMLGEWVAGKLGGWGTGQCTCTAIIVPLCSYAEAQGPFFSNWIKGRNSTNTDLVYV